MRRLKYNPLELPNYGLAEASRYLHVPMRTLRRWTGMGEDDAVLRIASFHPHQLSFKDMVELYILERIRETYGVNFERIRQAAIEVRERYPDKPRLADHEVVTDGRYVYLDHGDDLTNLSLRGQSAMKPILERLLKRIERDEENIALKIYPYTRKSYLSERDEDPPKVVEINPRVQFGMPVLVGSRITTSHLLSRRLGGDLIEKMAEDYGRSAFDIEEAVKWEKGRAA